MQLNKACAPVSSESDCEFLTLDKLNVFRTAEDDILVEFLVLFGLFTSGLA